MKQVRKNQNISNHYKVIALSSLAGFLTLTMTLVFNFKSRQEKIKIDKEKQIKNKKLGLIYSIILKIINFLTKSKQVKK